MLKVVETFLSLVCRSYRLAGDSLMAEKSGESIEEKIVAFIILVVEVGKEYEVLNLIKNIENVTEVRVVYGEYDLIARLEVDSMKKLEKSIMKIRNIKGVLRTATLISA